MTAPNANYSDILATTIERRSKKIADNVTKNNAAYTRLSQKGKIRTASGGVKIIEELSYAGNSNFSWYSGYDTLSTSPSEMLSAAEYNWKQAAAAVTQSGLEDLQNSGPEQQIDMLEAKLATTEGDMANQMSSALYSDGTGFGGKQITGLLAAVPVDPTTGTYGGIDRSTTVGTFWRSKLQTASGYASTTIQGYMNALWAKQVRGKDHPDLILFDNLFWAAYLGSVQPQQRFTDPALANLGFTTIKFMGADVVLDGGIGGYCPDNSGWFLNTDYLFLRPHSRRNMVPLDGKKRTPFNQDASATFIAWAGNLTCSNASLQGFLKGY